MLKALVQELAQGGGASRAELARRLDVSEGLVSQLLEDLTRRGYLAPLAPPSACGGCNGCGLRKAGAGCGTAASPPLTGWQLTAKGRRWLDR